MRGTMPADAAPLPSRPVDAVVLAGGDGADRLARAAGVAAKALVPFGGRPLGAYVARALRASHGVRHLVWVGTGDPATAADADAHVTPGGRMVDSLALGLGAAEALAGPPARRVLVVSADVPWLRGDDVDALLRAAPEEAELVYPVVSRAVLEARFPGTRRTWVRLREAAVTGGNLVLADADAWRRLLPWIERAGRARKRPWLLASMVGPLTWARLVAGRASRTDLERAVGRRVGVRAHAWLTDRPGVGQDLDHPEQWRRATPPVPDGAAEGVEVLP